MSISKWRSLTVALLVGCAAPPVATTVDAQTYQCASATNGEAYQLQTYLVEVVTGTDSSAIQGRAQYQLPITTASKVTYVTQASTCRTAALSFYTATGTTPPTSGTVLVATIKVSNTRYVVSVIGEHAGEFSITVTFDSKWHRLANVIG